MNDFQVKSDAVDVDAIMRQIRARIREKRGADYTEAEVRELAKVKLEQFIDPKGVRSDLVAQFRRHRPASAAPPNYVFEDDTLYETHRGLLRTIRRMLQPLLKLFFNPNTISSALHVQAKANQEFHERLRQREETDALYYELVHNLALEVTRLSIDVHNMKMRVESMSSRLDFDERRGRALESVVQYRPARPAGNQRPQPPQPQRAAAPVNAPLATVAPAETASADAAVATPNTNAPSAGGPQADRPDGDSERRRRRRRRRRRPGQTLGDQAGAPGAGDAPSAEDTADWVAEGGAVAGRDSGADTSSDSGSDEQ